MLAFLRTPLAQRRLALFRANRRGVWSLRIFLAVFALALAANIVANDRPLLVLYEGRLHFPMLADEPETTYGGDFETAADYRDPWLRQRIHAHGWALWPPIEFSYDTINRAIPAPAPTPPSPENWLGTDDQGRDVLARVLHGLRLSVLFGLALTILSSAIGVFVGAIQGYFGGWPDLVGQRVIEIWSGMPVLYLLLILASFVQPGVGWLLLLLLLFDWMKLVPVVRAEFLRARNFDYVRAARALGAGHGRIMLRHILPNAMVATITYLPFILNGAIATLTALDFLGFGLPPGSPSLGELLTQGKNNLQAPWLGLTGFLTVGVLLSLLIFIGEAVRDAFDPRRSVGIL